jgi:hypothetical protein
VGPLGARPPTPKQKSPLDTQPDEVNTNNNGNNNNSFVDIAVIRSNWYGRNQKRIYRFYGNYFDRVDPQGWYSPQDSVTGATCCFFVVCFVVRNADVKFLFDRLCNRRRNGKSDLQIL